MNKEKINVLIYGQSTYKNKGCEAIIETTLEKIKRSIDGNIIVSSNDSDDINKYKDVVSEYVRGYYKESELSEEERQQLDKYKQMKFDYMNFERMYQKDVIKVIDEVDLCLSVGGDNYFYGEPNWIYTINKISKQKGKKTVLWCASLFDNIESEEMIRDLKTYDLIIVRESLSYNALKKFIEEDRLLLEPDTAFSLKMDKIDLPDEIEKSQSNIGINLSPLILKYTEKADAIEKSVIELINQILEDKNNNIILIPHVYVKNNNDLEYLRKIKEEYYSENNRVILMDKKEYSCKELKYIISKCKFLIAARTHASIAAYSLGIPTLVLGYSVKSKGIAKDLFGNYHDYVIPVDEITSQILIRKYEKLRENSTEISKQLNNIILDYKKRAENLIIKMLEQLHYLDNKYVTYNNICTGCMACYNICPTNAINIIENEEGFYYPEIDNEKCIKCNLCKQICPENKQYRYDYKDIQYYAGKNKTNNEREESSSGGVFIVLAHCILEKDGIVYGAAWENRIVKHIKVDNKKDLKKLQGSKYVESEISDTYKQVKKDLQDERYVLFTGTPCQVEGLKAFLGKEYEKLYCVSVICHGVPSNKVLQKYLKEKEEKENIKIDYVKFRDKTNGWYDYNIQYISQDNKNKKIDNFKTDYFMKGFLKNYFLRSGCYSCDMKLGKKNTSDIILGDFWGIDTILPDFHDNKGVSAIIINSDKGKKIMNDIACNLILEPVTLEDILKGNILLKDKININKNRVDFFERIKKSEFHLLIDYMINNEYIKKQEEIISENNKKIQDIELKFKEEEEKVIDFQNKNERLSMELQNIYNSKR